jgi:hypothetical protein
VSSGPFNAARSRAIPGMVWPAACSGIGADTTFVANRPPRRARPKLASQIVLITSRTPTSSVSGAWIPVPVTRSQSTLTLRYSQDLIDSHSSTSGVVVNGEGSLPSHLLSEMQRCGACQRALTSQADTPPDRPGWRLSSFSAHGLLGINARWLIFRHCGPRPADQ